MNLKPPPPGTVFCWDEIHQKTVQVTGTRATPIGEWPLHDVATKMGSSTKAIVVTRSLADLVRSHPVAEVAEAMGVHGRTVSKWREHLGVADPKRARRLWTRNDLEIANSMPLAKAAEILGCSISTVNTLRRRPPVTAEEKAGRVKKDPLEGRMQARVLLSIQEYRRAVILASQASDKAGHRVKLWAVLSVAIRHGLDAVTIDELAKEPHKRRPFGGNPKPPNPGSEKE